MVFPMPRLTALVALAFVAFPAAALAQDCSSATAQPLPVRSTPVPPLYSGMSGRPAPLAAPRTILSESRDEALAVDVVLTRLRLEACNTNQFANYKPKTEFDNTPYRFNMEQGKKFSAAEFDAWMKSRGVRIVPAKPAAESVPATVGQ